MLICSIAERQKLMLETNDVLCLMRNHAREIFTSAVNAVNPARAVRRFLKLSGNRLTVKGTFYDLSKFDNICVIGAGKAGASMAEAVEDLLMDHIDSGIIIVKQGYTVPLRHIKLYEASHPIPDKRGIEATEKILNLLNTTTARDLVLCLISGGGSALLISPENGISLEDKQKITSLLLQCGATIHEINTVRKHLSKVKGGGLARAAYPATMICLIISDVIGDHSDIIASGPTTPDRSTFLDAKAILTRYSLNEKVPPAIIRHIEKGLAGKLPETPKEESKFFKNTHNTIIANNIIALKAAKQKAKELGYHSLILSSLIEGETRQAALLHAAIAREIHHSAHPVPSPACIISGGETTVKIKGTGLGGRNQEFVLAGSIEIQGLKNTVIASMGSDGTDGPTDAAGAIADQQTIRRAEHLGLDPSQFLENNDAYHFFKPLDDLIITGPTNTNVMDVRLLLVNKG